MQQHFQETVQITVVLETTQLIPVNLEFLLVPLRDHQLAKLAFTSLQDDLPMSPRFGPSCAGSQD